jgi:hypothetical protein
MTTYFETKEQYLNFRKAWAIAVNDERAKKKLEKNSWGDIVRVPGWTTSAHFMLYNILRGKSIYHGFVPVKNKNKLTNGAYINHGFYEAARDLRHVIRCAQASEERTSYQSRVLDLFMDPIKDVLTVEQLAKIKVPEIKPIESNYGKGSKIVRSILAGEIKTLEEVYDILNHQEAA